MDLALHISKQQKKFIDRGAKSGKQGLPPSGAEPLDLSETQLASEVKKLSQENYHEFKTLVSLKGKTLADISNGLSTVQPVCETVLGNQDLAFTASQSMSSDKSALIKLAEKMLTLQAEIRGFRIIHNITEEAVYPENPIAPYLWLLPVLLFETLLGAAFYENANGLIGGAFVALGVSLLNVGLAFACGALFRYKNLSPHFQKWGGWCALLAAMGLCIFMNSLFAAYRGEYQLLTDPSDPHQLGQAFLSAMSSAQHVFYLHSPAGDLASFTLLSLGVAGFAYAFYKGMHVADRHPGYGPRVRRLKEAEAAFETGCDSLREKVHHDLDEQKETLAKAKNTLMQARPAVEQIRLALATAHRDMQTQQSALQNAFELVLTAYRDTNVAVRATAAPAYFADLPDMTAGPMADKGDELTHLLDGMYVEIDRLKEDYQSRLTEAITEMGNKTRQLLGVDYALFVEEVTQQAKTNIDKAHVLSPKARMAV